MFRVTVLYPFDEARPFNRAHYLDVHIPLTLEKIGAHIANVTVEFGVGGSLPGSKPHFAAIASFDTESLKDFNRAFAQHAGVLSADLPNYSALPPRIQASELALPRS